VAGCVSLASPDWFPPSCNFALSAAYSALHAGYEGHVGMDLAVLDLGSSARDSCQGYHTETSIPMLINFMEIRSAFEPR
jgi:hypothetical protein